MAYLPPCEPLFPLSDDLSNIEVLETCEQERGTPDGTVVVHVPHGFLSAKGLNYEEHEPPVEGTH